MKTPAAAQTFHAHEAQAIARLWNGKAPTELSFEPVMRPDGRYVVVCIETDNVNPPRVKGYL